MKKVIVVGLQQKNKSITADHGLASVSEMLMGLLRRYYYQNAPQWMTKYSPPLGLYNYAAYLYQPHKYVRDLYDHARWFIQRGQRGYSDADVWNWCDHHSRVMVEVLKHLRKHRYGRPFGLTPMKWAKKLATMQEGFQAAIDEQEDYTSYKKLGPKEYRKLFLSRRRKLMLGLKYFRAHYQSLWD